MALEVVVDASVFLALLLEEELTPNAERFFSAPLVMHVPELGVYEIAHILAQRVRRNDLTPDQAVALFDGFSSLGRYVESLVSYHSDKLEEALACQMSPFDQAYLDLAQHLNLPLISADQRLIERGAISLSDY